MRRKAEILAEEQAVFDMLWYFRHMTQELPENTPQAIIDQANAAAEKIEKRADAEYLEELLSGGHEYGVLVGKLLTLRWMLGMEWDEEGILDT